MIGKLPQGNTTIGRQRILPRAIDFLPKAIPMKSNFSLRAALLTSVTFMALGYAIRTIETPPVSAASSIQAPSASQAAIDHLDHLSLLHIDHQPEEKHPWGSIRWLMTGKIDAGTAQSFGVVRINAGQQNTMHLHPNCEELFYVLSGSGETTVADQKVQLHPGDLIRIPANTFHQSTATGKEPLIAVISYNSPEKVNVNFGSNAKQ